MGLRPVIVADTHAWVWWVSSRNLLSSAARSALDSADSVGVSTITLLQIAALATRRRIEIDMSARDWIEAAVHRSGTIVLPLEKGVAIEAGSLIREFGDPADRIIVATAMSHSAPLVTKDKRIRASNLITTIW